MVKQIREEKGNINNFEFKYKFLKDLQNIQSQMQGQKMEQILNGIPCSLSNNEILQLGAKCSSEGYPLQKLIQIGRTLFKTSSDSCFRFLQYVEKHEFNRNIYKDFIHQQWKMQIYYSLAALALTKGTKESDKQSMEKWQKQFNKYLNLGSNVKTSTEKVYQLLHGFNSYYSGEFPRAVVNFNPLEQLDKKQTTLSTIALLGLAQCNFMYRKYDVALQYYKKALIANKNLPTKARLGMAYCFYELEKFELAQKCFIRILALDPKCVEAFLGIAVISYRNNNIQNYFQNLKQAYKLDPNHPLVVLHLSEHYLISGEYEKCQKLSQKGLELIEGMPKFLKKQKQFRDDYSMLKARFNNIIGQAYHAMSEYDQAKKYYELARERGLRFNDILLAQTLAHGGSYKQGQKILQTIFTSVKPSEVKIFSQFYKTLAYFKTKGEQKPDQQHNAGYYYKQALKFNRYDYNALVEYSTYLSDKNQKKQLLKVLQTALKATELQGKQPKAQLINNIAVTLLEDKDDKDKEKKEAEANFRAALKLLSEHPRTTQEEELKYHSLHLTVKFNWAFFLQFRHKNLEAIQIYDSLIKMNRYYIDAYLQIGDILHNLGQKQRAHQYLEKGIAQCSKLRPSETRMDRLYVLKAYLHHLDGNFQQSKETIRKLGKLRSHYDIILNVAFNYEALMRRQPEKMQYKEFLALNMNEVVKIGESDHQNVYSYMLLMIMMTIDKRLSKQQGNQYFSQLKIAERQFPAIYFNYGIFAILNQEYDNACFCFTRYKQRTRTNKADEYLALAQLLKGEVNECLNTLKKAIMSEPQNLKYRYQYAYANEKRVQKLYDDERNFKELKQTSKFLTVCKKIYQGLSKLSTSDYLKIIEYSQMKQKTKNQLGKLRSIGEDRDRYVKSQLGYYSSKEKQIIDKEMKILEEENQKLLELKKAKENQQMRFALMEDQESDQERARKQRHKLLQQKIQAQNRQALRLHLEQQQQQRLRAEMGQQTKKKRKNPEGKRTKKQKKVKSEQEQDYSEREEKNQQENQYESEDEYEEEERRKKKKHKKASRDRSLQVEDKKKKKMKKRQRKQHSQREDYQSDFKNQDREDVNSEKGSNPFDQKDQSAKEQEQKELRAREEPQKKKKKEKKDEQEEIDLKAFQINM